MRLCSVPASVPRTPGDPGPHEVYAAMQPGEPYTVRELADEFDVSRWTIQRRLETLESEGFVEKKRHSQRRVSFWVPAE